MTASITPLHRLPDTQWHDEGPTRAVEPLVEDGGVLVFEQLNFAMSDAERRFLDARWTDGKAKNISLRWPTKSSRELRGALGDAADLSALETLIARYAENAERLMLRLFPHYRPHLVRGNTSLRPVAIEGRASSWRKDDSRLHIDAFPSNPTRGARLLRVFTNVNPEGQPRRWRVGETFEAHARRFLPRISRPLPGSAWALQTLHITKRRRTEYDHLMLHLHDLAKSDAEFQRASPQLAVEFAPGTTWVTYSDQVPHAVMAGQHMFEQTFMLEAEHQQRPGASPLCTLERLTGRALR